MQKIDFNQEWMFKRLEDAGEGEMVSLPHDAMCKEKRSGDSRGEHNIGWFESYDYQYRKFFMVPREYENKTLILEFEGVYHNAEVYVNGQKAMYRPYGYTCFAVELNPFLKYGQSNEIRVIARNADQPNSRWYSGSGIYRPVWLYVGEKEHILLNGVKVSTVSVEEYINEDIKEQQENSSVIGAQKSQGTMAEGSCVERAQKNRNTVTEEKKVAGAQKKQYAQVEVSVKTSLPGKVEISFLDAEGREVLTQDSHEAEDAVSSGERNRGEKQDKLCTVDTKAEEDGYETRFLCTVEDAQLWSVERPYLYTCVIRFGGDEVRECFGIRTLTWTAEKGLAINGEHVILKGACIHHDNGVLGACAFPEAEERKIRLLKETGYNAIRSAHNPCSKALLDACDRLGMLVMDEYVDMWYIHKNRYDYASYMQEWWREDLKDMVEKDYNHPSVVLYSTGNEVAETGEKKGIELTGQMTEYLHSLDSTRPVSCGINIFFNFLYSLGFGVYSDERAEKDAKNAQAGKKKTVGSEFYNTMAGLCGDKAMKIGATLHGCDVKTRDAYANMDIAGYNYGIFRYRHDLKKYPDRLILGSETFCKDAYAFLELAKKEPRIVGDFVWAGMDYIGEAGIGSWEYEDYATLDSKDPGWLTAGSGRLDILGFGQGEAAYTRVALEKEAGPLMAVRPVYQKGKHSPSAWKMTDAKQSWSWPGYEGKQATVEVYARAAYVELLLNGKSIGKKQLKNCCNVTFKVPYEPGELTCVSYEEGGRELGRYSLHSAGEDTKLTLVPETETVKADGLDFIRLQYTDAQGIWKPMEKHRLKVEVENGSLEGFGNACPYNKDGYWQDTTKTYYGEALAVIRAGKQGNVTIRVTDEGGEHLLVLPIEE